MHTTGERRVVVGVSGSLGSIAALHRAVAEVRSAGGTLWAVLAWEAPLTELGPRGSFPSPSLSEDCRREAVDVLVAALDTAFGGAEPGVPTECFVARGAPGQALVDIADREDDLLVVGTGRRGLWRRALFPSVARFCVAHAACPVLTVPPSPLQRTLEAVTRGHGSRMDLRELKHPAVGGA
ncbi:universal stress protein [Streptomyces montanisoli]|uniref:Universal stress protein n=1 Tax=Streptomyces montanisoli TaxID=2798581 RepID=A0A940RYL6_9ACTN|nr:universal stress protein [Streptomyces montanisoli]MBP0459308.1 universal stress protein [Streptomyces montanisoli]